MSIGGLRRNMKLSVTVGAGMGVLYSAIALIGALGGSRTLQQMRLPAWAVVGLYLTSGVVAGLFVGLLIPIARHMLGAVVVGALTGFLTVLLLSLSLYDLRGSLHWALVLGSAFGGPMGFYVWYIVHKERRWHG